MEKERADVGKGRGMMEMKGSGGDEQVHRFIRGGSGGGRYGVCTRGRRGVAKCVDQLHLLGKYLR